MYGFLAKFVAAALAEPFGVLCVQSTYISHVNNSVVCCSAPRVQHVFGHATVLHVRTCGVEMQNSDNSNSRSVNSPFLTFRHSHCGISGNLSACEKTVNICETGGSAGYEKLSSVSNADARIGVL